MRKSRLLLLTFCHFQVDTYSTMLAPILPLVMLRLDLNNAAAGLLGTVVAFIGMAQPVMGLWADRLQRRPFVVLGLLLAAVFMPLLGLAPTYWLTVLALALGGVGVAAFHPASFALAGDLSGHRRAFGLALFIFGGTIALGITPLWINRFAAGMGLERLPWLTLPGIGLAALLWRAMPAEAAADRAQDLTALVRTLRPHGRVLALITAVVTLRSVTSISFSTFLPVLEHERGVAVGEAGSLPLSVYLISGVVGALIAGYLADRIPSRTLVWGGILLSAPFLWGYLHVPADWTIALPLPGHGSQLPAGWLAYVLLALGGGLILSSNSVLVAIAQEVAPQSASLASSLPQGFAWGLGGMVLPLVGHVADQIGMQQTLSYLALLPVATAALALLLPHHGTAAHAAPLGSATTPGVAETPRRR